MIAQLPVPFYIFSLGVLTFGALVIARWVLHLANETRSLAAHARTASETLSRAAEEVSAEAEKAVRARDEIKSRHIRPGKGRV